MNKTIAIMNEKGGVAKTTTAMHFAYLLAKKNYKILLIDYDGQANSTMNFGINQNELKWTIYELLKIIVNAEELPKCEEFIINLKENLDIIPSCAKMFNLPDLLSTAYMREETTKLLIEYIKENKQYDYIIFDTNPQLGQPMINVMTATNEIIIPCELSPNSVDGVATITNQIKNVRRGNKNLKINGILFTKVEKRTKIAESMEQETLERIPQDENIKIYKMKIPKSVKISEAMANFLTINEYDKTSPCAKAYEDFVNEFLENEKMTTCQKEV